jgi:Predicted nucleotide-binding protein containing TIR-like domain
MKGADHKPIIFIGSSSEKLNVAEKLKELLKDFAQCNVWNKKFPLSTGTLESLIDNLDQADFGILILSDDDEIEIRKQRFKISRANVIFESGISIGSLSKSRTFLVVPMSDPDYHLPSDLAGFTIAGYRNDILSTDPDLALKDAVEKIKDAIHRSLWSRLDLTVNTRIMINERKEADHKMKIFMTLTNDGRFPITCRANEFRLNQFYVDDGLIKTRTYIPSFLHHTDTNLKKEVRKRVLTVDSGETTNCFVPVEISTGLNVIKHNMMKIDCGEFDLTCIVHGDNTDRFGYRVKVISDRFENLGDVDFRITDLIGMWENRYDKTGAEKVYIDPDYAYWINSHPRPSFAIRDFNFHNGIVSFTKASIGVLPTFTDRLTMISSDIIIGEEITDGRDPHQIRYIRKGI